MAKSVFDKNYISFMCNVILQSPCSEQKEYKLFTGFDLQHPISPVPALATYSSEFECWKFFIVFITNVVLRLKKDTVLPLYPLLCGVKRALERSVGLSLWLIENFSQPDILREFLVHCPVSHPRFFVVSMLISASKVLYLAHERDKLAKLVPGSEDTMRKHILKHGGEEGQTSDSRPVYFLKPFGHKFPYVMALVNNLLYLWNAVATKREHFAHFSLLLSRLARMGPEVRKFLLSAGALGAIFDQFMESPSGIFGAILGTRRCIESKKTEFNVGFEKVVPRSGGPQGTTKKSVLKPAQQSNAAAQKRVCRKQKFLVDLFSQVRLRHVTFA